MKSSDPKASGLRVVIRVEETLGEPWAAWFEGLEVEPCPVGGTRLSGCLPDHAALHGILDRVRDLNLRLVSVEALEISPKEER